MFSILGLMIFSCLSQIALSCTCGLRHPQSAYCDSAVVIRAKFIGKSQSVKRQNGIQYQLKTLKVYKAPEQLEEIEFVHTAALDSLCGYVHTSSNRSTEFLVTGYVVNDMVMINTCGFIAPWDSLTASQMLGFQQVYEKSCSCQVVPCYNLPCQVSSPRDCLWTDMVTAQDSAHQGPQALHMACVGKGNDTCGWGNQKYRLRNRFKSKKE